MLITLTATPSLNKLKSGWSMWQWKKKYGKELSGYEVYALKEKMRMAVTVTRYGSREFDKDNFFGGMKPLLDSLKKTGLIVDDRSEWLELCGKQVKCKRGEEKTVVEIVKF